MKIQKVKKLQRQYTQIKNKRKEICKTIEKYYSNKYTYHAHYNNKEVEEPYLTDIKEISNSKMRLKYNIPLHVAFKISRKYLTP